MRPNKAAVNGPLFEHNIESLRTGFQLLDPNRTGFISYKQLCNHWDELPVLGTPKNFLEDLHDMTLPDGTLTYDRFIGAAQSTVNGQLNGTKNDLEK
ncbi:unnamed protein product [Gongylonema pulchrum]|uniref:EF-hand domain-containing protein n=1 Tax=Gongylonema pulchrum TaxID=637853 RepID=A0A183CWX2_9BILA|nr:unnamed protein product [Gongylonema pulchrum]